MILSLLKIVRFENLILIALTQVLIKFFFFEPFKIPTTLNGFGFFLLCLATVSIAAAGNIINDIYDVETDRINRPGKVLIGNRISEKTAMTAFMVLNVLGIGIGFYLSNMIQRPGFSSIFIFISVLLYLYATHLKQILLVGNLIISSLVAMVIIIMGLFDLLPAITPQNQLTQSIIFSILLDYALFAFLINLLREMVKDQEDINGDFNSGRNSLPIAIGKERTNKVIFIIGIIPLVLIVIYIYQYLYENLYATLYTLFLIVGPLLYFLINITATKTTKQFSHLSTVLKIIMFLGLISIGLYPFIL